jgi:hypothetical protein
MDGALLKDFPGCKKAIERDRVAGVEEWSRSVPEPALMPIKAP